MSEVYAQNPSGELLYTFDWTADVPAGVSISSVAYTVPTPLDKYVDSPDLANKKSTIGLRAFEHGNIYQILAVATMSNGEKVPKTLTVRGFKGA